MNKLTTISIGILIEVLLILLVATVYDSFNIKIILPKDNLPRYKDGSYAAIIGLRDKDTDKIIKFYDPNTKKWKDVSDMTKYVKTGYNFVIDNLQCSSVKECDELETPYSNVKKSIMLIGELNDELSGMISTSCIYDSSKCANVEYHITEDGRVDRKRLAQEYPFFKSLIRIEQ